MYNQIRNSKTISDKIKKLKDYEALLLKIKTMGQEDLMLEDVIAKSKLNLLVRFKYGIRTLGKILY